MRRMMLAGLITALPFALIAGAAAREKGATLRVEGLVTRPGTYTTSQLSALKRHTIKVDDHGTPAVYEGVSLTEVLALAGAPVGDEMRGSKLSLVVVAKAADDYVVAYALAELDPGSDQLPPVHPLNMKYAAPQRHSPAHR